MTVIRKIGAVVALTPLATGMAVLATPAGAAMAASTGINSPSNGAVITHGSSVTVSATSGSLGGTLIITTPEGNTIPGGKNGWGGGKLSVSVPIPTNGTYKVELQGLGGGNSTFVVKENPAAPSGVNASSLGGTVSVFWNEGTETDLTGYTVKVGAKSRSAGVASFCSGSTCTANLAVSQTTGSLAVTVTAKRAGGTSASSSTQVALGGSGGGNTGSGGTIPTLPTGTGAGSPLTPTDTNSPVSLPTVAPEGSNPNLAYPTQAPQVAPNQLATSKASGSANDQALQWGKSVAIALILLLCAAHLGTWTRRLRAAQAAGGPSRASRLGRARVTVANARIAQAEALAKAGVLSKESVVGAAPKRKKRKKGARDNDTVVLEPAALQSEPPEQFEPVPKENSESVTEALAALTRGEQTRVDLGLRAAADELFDPAPEPEPVPEPRGEWSPYVDQPYEPPSESPLAAFTGFSPHGQEDPATAELASPVRVEIINSDDSKGSNRRRSRGRGRRSR